MVINREHVIEKISETLVAAGSAFRPDKIRAYERAIAEEKNESSRWVLETILEDAKVAERDRSPLCDDTGIPHVFIEIGPERTLTGEILEWINEGVEEGLRRLPGRPMAVKGDDIPRIQQSEGLYDQSEMVKAAPPIIKSVEEDVFRVHIIMQGGGPAIRGITHRIFHKHDIEVVKDEIIKRATEGAKQLGCTPCTLAIGIGRSQYEATNLMMEAQVHGNFDVQSDLEKAITDGVNESNIGPLGLGGRTVLATFLKVGQQRASGVRIVCIRPCCCFEPRIASVEL